MSRRRRVEMFSDDVEMQLGRGDIETFLFFLIDIVVLLDFCLRRARGFYALLLWRSFGDQSVT